MKTRTALSAITLFAFLGAGLLGCSDEDESSNDSAVQDAAADMAADGPAADAAADGAAMDGATDGQASDGATDAAAGDAAALSYAVHVQPILQQKCAPCHTTQGAGGFNHASSYAATQMSSTFCNGQMVYDCMLTRIQNGSMPQGAECSGNPVQDAENTACLTQQEQDVIEGWITGGAQP